jgi:6-phosphogluconolactonase
MRSTLNYSPEVRVYPDATALAEAAAEVLARTAARAVGETGRFHVALAGGSTPRAVYERIAADELSGRSKLPWASMEIFFGDERCVPPDHAESNFRMAREALLDRVPIPPENIHRIHGELEPKAAAQAYEAELKRVVPLHHGGLPRLDLVLLGVGQDGHTASLFPGTPALEEKTRAVVANPAPRPGGWRVTLTLPALSGASNVLFLVLGAEKAPMLRRVLRTDTAGARFPAQRVRPTAGWLRWFLDEAAASELGAK